MNYSSKLITIVPKEVTAKNLVNKFGATFCDIIPADGVGLNKIMKGLQDMLETENNLTGRIMFTLPITVSSRLKRIGARLVSRTSTGKATFLLDLDEYIKYKNLEQFTEIEVDDFLGDKVTVHFTNELPTYYSHRLEEHGANFLDKVFNKDNIAYVEVPCKDDIDCQEKYITNLAEANRSIFSYYGIHRLLVALPYDYDSNRLKGINHSFVGRFKEISRSFLIIYVGQNKDVKPKIIEKVNA